MKTITHTLLFLSLWLLASTGATAQVTASQAGIAVQGIARDANNTLRANQTVNLEITMYYEDNGSRQTVVNNPSLQVNTDAFGVFSFVFNVPSSQYPNVANREVFLEIKEGNTIISNEALSFVPYAIAASNGVPTGAIMPYMGTTAPPGWLLCNGQSIDQNAQTQALRDFLEASGLSTSNTPDLSDKFLASTGTANGNTPGTQGGENSVTLTVDQMPAHNHGGLTGMAGAFDPAPQLPNGGGRSFQGLVNVSGGASVTETDNDLGLGNEFDLTAYGIIREIPNHEHTISSQGGGQPHENRPAFFTVNFIIKL